MMENQRCQKLAHNADMNYKWSLKDYPKKHNKTVFTTFACGGGSTMGYKLAGYNVLGANDIDPKMEMIYRKNHNPKHYFLCDIRDLINSELPKELYNLDILDGSPPCTSFSIAGNREKDWGKKKKFSEGQAFQKLDDLYFRFLELAEKLKPKVIITENVAGLVQGKAKTYWRNILKKFDEIGYTAQTFMLNGATMGVPQARVRVFIIGHRKDIDLPKLKLGFNERPIILQQIEKDTTDICGAELSDAYKKWWIKMGSKYGSFSKVHPKGSFFNTAKCSPYRVLNTIIATSGAKMTHYSKPNELSSEILKLAGSFPQDYDFMGLNIKYVIGMSVPPLMIAKVSEQVKKQWLDNIK